jgi:DNA polymerase I-like protein with 3'-5' exonuclease and polymerase domains
MTFVIDFETKRIINGSGVAPRPVGVSIQRLGQASKYYGWGHPINNNSTPEEGRAALAAAWNSGEQLIFHNAKFDISVAIEHMGLEWPVGRFDDTMYLLYLFNPIAQTLSLKPNAEALLGLPPDEQNELHDWLIANQKPEWLSEGDKGVNKTNVGAYISFAPGDIVGKYAEGDTHRTGLMYEFLLPKIEMLGMWPAYQREIALTRIGYDMESVGVRVDREALMRDQAKYLAVQERAAARVRELLQCPGLELGKARELAKAIEASPLASPLRRTPTGLLSTAADALEEAIHDKELLAHLRHYKTLQTLTGTFYKNWIRFSARDGNVHPSWNQVRGEHFGTRTGRFSCSEPNLTNVPTEFDDPIMQGLDIPFMRRYILPDEGMIILPADYNGQEMRGLAHFAEGRAMEIYRDDPRADFHEVAARLVKETSGLSIKRKQAKITGFSLIYGAGVPALAAQLGVDPGEAATIKNAYLKAIPGLSEFQRTFDYRSEVRTWGGRIIPVEPARMFKGRLWTFNYKLCNYLIQGSAADQTKEALIRYDASKCDGDVLMTVHDEIVIQVPMEKISSEVKLLKAAMEDQPGWDVPFVAEVEYGKNWHDLENYLG